MAALQGGSDRPPGALSIEALVSEDPDLESRYRAYRTRQAQALLSLLPNDAVRPLYARARSWAGEVGIEVGKDPLATLLLFLQEVIPLPSFDLWLKDRSENLEAHLEEEFTSAPAHRRPSPPVMVESRAVRLGDTPWRASLGVIRHDRGSLWIGGKKIEGPSVRTADIFREENPEEIRSRFLSLNAHTLLAFLRSLI